MFILKFLETGATYEVDAQYINNNVVQITGENFNPELSGFILSREENPDKWDYSLYKTIYRTVENGVQFSNNESVYTVDTKIKVVWDDSNNKEEVRPTSMKVAVKKNNKKFETITLDADDNWEKVYTDTVTIPEYSVSPSAIDEYEATVDGLVITERHECAPEPEPEPTPTWQDKMEAQLTYTAMETNTLLDMDEEA